MQRSLNLPEEIIVDILSRLPAKCVGRCRCVSRRWRALLCQPQFIRTHVHRGRYLREGSLIYVSQSGDSLCCVPLSDARHLLDEITVPATGLTFISFFPNSIVSNSIKILASCDGLLLIDDEVFNKVVLNPITREITEIPREPCLCDEEDRLFAMHGLGYESATDDYKVVTLFPNMTETANDSSHYYVFSLKSGTWKDAGVSPYRYIFLAFQSGIFVDGHIHWTAMRRTDNNVTIVAFDLAEEKFCEVPPPSSIDGEFLLRQLAVVGGCLCMFDQNKKDLWVMKEYGVQESWTRFTIDIAEETIVRSLYSLGQEQVLMLKDEQEPSMYNLKGGTMKNIVLDGDSDDLYLAKSFVESLVSPHGSNKLGEE